MGHPGANPPHEARGAPRYPPPVCGRYTLTAAPAQVAEHFDVASGPGLAPRFNVAPGQEVPAVLCEASGRVLASLRWGLVPGWAKSAAFGARAINARVESAAARPAFREAYRKRRCLLPADGFYEWRARPGGAEPHHVALPGRRLFAFAGLHERFEHDGAALRSVAILTCPARGRIRELHGRMPVIVAPEDYDAWLDPARCEPDALAPLLGSRLSDELEFRAVDARVNDVRFDEPACLAPAAQLSCSVAGASRGDSPAFHLVRAHAAGARARDAGGARVARRARRGPLGRWHDRCTDALREGRHAVSQRRVRGGRRDRDRDRSARRAAGEARGLGGRGRALRRGRRDATRRRPSLASPRARGGLLPARDPAPGRGAPGPRGAPASARRAAARAAPPRAAPRRRPGRPGAGTRSGLRRSAV